jgi:hypothetical protein
MPMSTIAKEQRAALTLPGVDANPLSSGMGQPACLFYRQPELFCTAFLGYSLAYVSTLAGIVVFLLPAVQFVLWHCRE